MQCSDEPEQNTEPETHTVLTTEKIKTEPSKMPSGERISTTATEASPPWKLVSIFTSQH